MGPASEDPGHDPGFVLPGDEEPDLSRRGEGGGRQREPRHEGGLPASSDGHDRASTLSHRGLAGKERGGVTVRPDPEEHEIEPGEWLGPAPGQRTDLSAVAAGGLRRRPKLAQHPVDAVPQDRRLRQERCPGHSEIALGPVGGDASFVREEDLGLLPREPSAERPAQQGEELPGSTTARDDPGKASPLPDGLGSERSELARKGTAGAR